MNVLVTGGAGYIGSHACVELLNAGHSVVVVDNLVNANAECLRRVERITGKTLEYHEMDLLNRAALNELFDTHSFDCVLHFAGLKAVGESVQQPLRYYNNNLGTTIHLCQTMAAHGVKKILFSSSATVYSPDNTMPVDESARTGGCTLELTVDAPRDCALFTTIPAEEGWTVQIDGEYVNWDTCLDESLICVPVSEGKHTIVLNFYPAGLSSGLILTGIGMMILAGMVIVCSMLRCRDKELLAEREDVSGTEDFPENGAE